MAFKVPIITSVVQRIKEICRNDEYLLFKTDNFKGLSQKIEFLLKSEDFRYNLVPKAFEKVKDFTYLKRCEKIFGISKG